MFWKGNGNRVMMNDTSEIIYFDDVVGNTKTLSSSLDALEARRLTALLSFGGGTTHLTTMFSNDTPSQQKQLCGGRCEKIN